jgi:hypothetical protein
LLVEQETTLNAALEYDYVTSTGSGQPWTIVPLGLPTDIGHAQLVLDDKNQPHVVAWESTKLLHVWHDTTGVHTDSFTAAQATTVFSAGWNAASQRLEVIAPAAGMIYRDTAGAWTSTAFPTGVPASALPDVSNLVFDASGAISFVQAQSTETFSNPLWNTQVRACSLAGSGTCATVFNGTNVANPAMFPLLTVDATGQHLAVLGGTTGPATVFDAAGAAWTETDAPAIPGDNAVIDSMREGAVGGDSADKPVYALLVSNNMWVARFTGTDWQYTTLAPPTGLFYGGRSLGENFAIASRGQQWMMAAVVSNNASPYAWQIEVDSLP